jgi:hypothetical protein
MAEVIVIGPLWADVRSADVRRFASIAEFDRWRAKAQTLPTMGPAVDAALGELGLNAPPSILGGLFTWLREQQRVPCTKELIAHWSSRRSFYRAWQMMPEGAALFSRRVRRHYSAILAARGHSAVEIAVIAQVPVRQATAVVSSAVAPTMS